MEAGTAYNERHNQADNVYRNICTIYTLDFPKE